MGIANLNQRDQHWMQHALSLANKAQAQQEVPVGAVIVLADEAIGEGCNQSISTYDPSAHAEIVALRVAAAKQQSYRLTNSTLYVTLEPCVMCTGALIHARIKRLVFGTLEPKSGAIASQLYLLDSTLFNHRVTWEGGCMAQDCAHLLKNFFALKRLKQE